MHTISLATGSSSLEGNPLGGDNAQSKEDHPSEMIARFNQWYDRFYEPLYRYLMGKVHDPCWAEDLVQETFLRAWRNPPTDLSRGISPWLFRVAHNCAMDHFHHTKDQASGDDVLENIPGPLTTPSPEQTDASIRVTALLDSAVERDQNILALLGAEYTIADIARQLNLSHATVKSALQRFRQRCKKTGDTKEKPKDGARG